MSVLHDTFVIERTYDVTPAKVFAAWSSAEAKTAWFMGPDENFSTKLDMDFRVGGRESITGGPTNGPTFSYNAEFRDIVPDERIVSSYEMHMDDVRISVSLATIEFIPDGDGTRMVYTEQGAYLDGHDKPSDRLHGTNELLDNLGRMLAAG